MKEIVHLGKHYFPDFGGIETATQNLAETGVKLGLPVSCYTSGTSACFRKKYQINGVKIFRATTFGRLLSTPIAPGMLLFLRRYQHDLILHVHVPNPIAELCALFQTLINKNKCHIFPFFHALPFRGKGIGKIWFQCITKPLLRRSKSILISHAYLLETFPALTEFSSKIIVAPFVTDVPKEELVKSWWNEKEKIVLAVGRLVPYKGFSGLLSAWEKFQKQNPGFRLVILGDGPQKNFLLREIERLNLIKSVRILSGQGQEEKINWLKKSLLFVLPSLNESETFGIAAQEAMAHGLPLLTSDLTTGLRSLTRKGACGKVVRAGNVDDLSSALSSLLIEQPEKLSTIGLENRKYIEENFSPRALQEIYQRIVSDL